MKKIITIMAAGAAALAMNANSDFISVKDGEFVKNDKPYRYVGTNFWYGAILGSEGRGGNRERLAKELDLLQDIGIDNLRVLVGGDGSEEYSSHIQPVLQPQPGVYNDTILDGLDYLMAELERRGMNAVLFLNNSWEWSGGYGTYLEWAGEGKAPNPATDGYQAFMNHVSKFVTNDKAKELFANHVNNIVTRTNRYTGKPYTESPAIMSWQIANEPRCFNPDPKVKEAFAEWILDTARQIHSLDPNHMVSTGSEGMWGCEEDIELWDKIHSAPEISYGIVHLWPYNWSWISKDTIIDGLPTACANTEAYLKPHAERMKKVGKPLVLEEFGYPRDNFSFTPGTPTTGRDGFYDFVFSLIRDTDMIAGCNFWGWGGYAAPTHIHWEPGDDYVCDPSQEEQGLNSVFAKDKSTIEIIRTKTKEILGE